MKIYKLLIIAIAIISFSCSKDEDVLKSNDQGEQIKSIMPTVGVSYDELGWLRFEDGTLLKSTVEELKEEHEEYMASFS